MRWRQAVRWRPSLPDDVGRTLGIDLTRPPREDDLLKLFSARRADNGHSWSRVRRKISAIDFITQPHKSVTLAAEFAPTAAEAATIWSCIDEANDSAMLRLVAELGWARRGQGGRGGAVSGSTAWVSFRHYVAHPTLVLRYGEADTRISVEAPGQGDPHAHIHNVLFNIVVTADGRVGSLDTQRLTRAVLHLCGAHFQAELARLLRAAGIRVVCHPNGTAAVLPAVDSRAVELFSSRNAILGQVAKEYVERIGFKWDTLDAAARGRFERGAAKLTRLRGIGGKPSKQYWIEQAEMIGWRHTSVLEKCVGSEALETGHVERAYNIAVQQVARELASGNVLDKDWLKVYAARALIVTGMSEALDIDRVGERLTERFSAAERALEAITPSFRQRRRRHGPKSLLLHEAADE
ncbi:MobF family relaxase [Muricoccus vinaceus]|uniref:MobF family relaxase n=1 Tax=Muricoccus vinaceus TaxID=424704 RepID=A0ABV6IW46_9PROT